MFKPNGKTPINCDVFCLEDVTRKHFGDINITGHLYLSPIGVFKAGNVSVKGDFITNETSLNLKEIQVGGDLIFDKSTSFFFDTLDVNNNCLINSDYYSEKEKTLVDCDVFCTEGGYIPDNICITGNLYIANHDVDYFTHIETGEDIFIESSKIDSYSIKSQGSINVYGEKKKGFNFDSLIALDGCNIYSK